MTYLKSWLLVAKHLTFKEKAVLAFNLFTIVILILFITGVI